MTMELLFLAGLISTAIVGWWHWENNVKQIPLKEFGPDEVKRVLSFEPKSVQNAILNRGSMTRVVWGQMVSSQLKSIKEELAKREGK